MKYLVTGAAGFVGANLARKIIENGDEFFGMDNFSDYYSSEMKRMRVQELLESIGSRIILLDLMDKPALATLIARFEPDAVIHLAAQPGVRLPLAQTEKYVQANLVGFSNILEVCVGQQVPDFLYASSSSVYGNSTNIPYLESEGNLRPISFYGATKLSNELLAYSLAQNSRTSTRGMRFFTVYGPWGRPDMAYLRLISSAISGRPFRLFGDGNVRRDFTFIQDNIQAIILLSKEMQKSKTQIQDIVNVGGGTPHSILNLIDCIEELIGGKIEIDFQSPEIGDVKETVADTQALYRLTGFTPVTSIEQGVGHTIDWALRPDISSKLIEWIDSK